MISHFNGLSYVELKRLVRWLGLCLALSMIVDCFRGLGDSIMYVPMAYYRIDKCVYL